MARAASLLILTSLFSLLALSHGMHVTVKGQFLCYLPVAYSKVALMMKTERGDGRMLGVGTTDINGAYSLSTVIPEAFYDIEAPSVDLYVVPLYHHESAYRGTLRITRFKMHETAWDQTPVYYGVKPGAIVDFRATKLRSNTCHAYTRFMQELSDFARFIGPLPARLVVTLDSPFPNIRIDTETAFVPRGRDLTYSSDTRPIMYSFIRHNYDGSLRQFRENARNFGYFDELPPDQPSSFEYAFNWAWYRYNAGGGCPTKRPIGRMDVPETVYQALYSIFCTCLDNGATFKEITTSMLDVFRKYPGQVLTFFDFETRFHKITRCGYQRVRPVAS